MGELSRKSYITQRRYFSLMKSIVVITIALALLLPLFASTAVLAQPDLNVWSSFSPPGLEVEVGETATVGLWISGPGFDSVTTAEFVWCNAGQSGDACRTQTVDVNAGGDSASASDSFAPTDPGFYWVFIHYYSPDLPDGFASAPAISFNVLAPPETAAPTTTEAPTTVATSELEVTTTAPTTTAEQVDEDETTLLFYVLIEGVVIAIAAVLIYAVIIRPRSKK